MPILDPATTLAKKKGRYPLAASDASITADAQSIGNPIDVIEPGRDQGDLKDGFILETGGAQPIMVSPGDPGRVLRELDYIIQHDAFSLRDRRRPVIFTQCPDQVIVQRYPAQ